MAGDGRPAVEKTKLLYIFFAEPSDGVNGKPVRIIVM